MKSSRDLDCNKVNSLKRLSFGKHWNEENHQGSLIEQRNLGNIFLVFKQYRHISKLRAEFGDDDRVAHTRVSETYKENFTKVPSQKATKARDIMEEFYFLHGTP